MTTQFALSKEPLDYQVSVHINNMFNTYSRFEVMSCYDFIRESDFEIGYENFRPDGVTDRIAYALYNMIMHYGWKKMDLVLTELFGEEVNINVLLKQRGVI